MLQRLIVQWGLTLGQPLPGGSASYVVRATTAGGVAAVLKVGVPGHDLAVQAEALQAADGEGYLRLLGFEPSANAVLLEALGPSLQQSGRTAANQAALIGRVLRRSWRRADPHQAASPVKARGLADLVTTTWAALGRPCPDPVIAAALSCAERRAAAYQAERCVHVHGDPHPGNLLACPPRPGAPEGYVLIDPDPFVDDPAYDLGVVLRDWCGQLGSDPVRWLRSRCAELAALTGIDAEAIWDWAYLERVSTGLYVLTLGAERVARPFLDSAAQLLQEGVCP